jgi:prepilin-type N-terminal cleavage/methylation domain-containing protein
MKRAFTLIELLVVIAIIAILAAILFPVFARAKEAAKRAAGMTQVKQIGTAAQIYLADSDDVWFPYRTNGSVGNGCTGTPCSNPDYQKLYQASGAAVADVMFGSRSRDVVFYKQLLDPYTKNNDIFKTPGNKNNAWSGYDPANVDTEPQFRSYGGSNSYGLNNFMFQPVTGAALNGSQIAEVANTLMMIDASYYNVLPRGIQRLDGSTWNPCTSTYPRYWKNLGNSYVFRWTNGALAEPTDAEALKLIDARYAGQLLVVRADTSTKSLNSKAVVDEFVQKGPNKQSMWDPFKTGPINTTFCY